MTWHGMIVWCLSLLRACRIPPPALGEHAAMLSFSPFGVFSFLGVVPSLTTQNFVATFSYYSTTQDIVFALNTDDIGGVTTEFFLLPQTGRLPLSV